MRRNIILSGFYSGKTVKLGDFQFVNGQITLDVSDKDFGLLSSFIEKNWQGYPEGDPRLGEIHGTSGIHTHGAHADRQAQVPSHVQSPVDAVAEDSADAGTEAGDTDTGTEEQQAPVTPRAWVNERLQKAVLGLDPKDGGCWTQAGLPAIAAVEKVLGDGGVTRAQIEAVAPGFVRIQTPQQEN